MARFAVKILLFAAVPLIGSLSNLLIIPAVSSRFGIDVWAATAVGLSIGAGGSVLIELGWGLNGPYRIARCTSELNRSRLLVISLSSKLLMALPVLALVFLATIMLSPSAQIVSAAVAIGTALGGLSPSWFFIGSGKPGLILLIETVPRVLFFLSAAFLIENGGPLLLYPVATTCASLLPVLGALVITRAPLRYSAQFGLRRIGLVLALQSTALRGRAASAVYISLSVSLVALGGGAAAVAPFAAVEKLFRMALQFLQSVPHALQSWVGSSQSKKIRQARVRRSIAICFILGAVSGGVFMVVAPYVCALLFGDAISLDLPQVLVGALVITTSCTSRAVGGIGLVSQNRIKTISNSATIGASVALIAIPLLAWMHGSLGGLLGVLICELFVLAYQLGAYWRPAQGFRSIQAL